MAKRELLTVLKIAKWLEERGLRVLHERAIHDHPDRGVFGVKGVERGKHPDLLVRGMVTAAGRTLSSGFVAIEVKPGNKHRDILDGFDVVLAYFVDYACGARYEVEGTQVDIAAIVLATSYGPEGVPVSGRREV